MQYFEDIQIKDEKMSAPYTVSKESIISFAKEFDPQPFHISEEEASKWPLGLTASGTHIYALSNKLAMTIASKPLAVVAGLGVDEMRTLQPVRPNDNLRAVCCYESKRESNSKPNMGIITSLIKLVNQRDEVVFSYKASTLIMKRPVGGA